MAHIKIEQPKCWGVTQFWLDKFSPFCFVILVSHEKCRFWKTTKGRQTWFKGTKRIKRQLKMHTNLKLLKGIVYVHNFAFPIRQIALGKKTWGDYYFLTRFGTLQFIFSGGFSSWFVITWWQFCMNFETIFFNIFHWWWCWGWWWVKMWNSYGTRSCMSFTRELWSMQQNWNDNKSEVCKPSGNAWLQKPQSNLNGPVNYSNTGKCR